MNIKKTIAGILAFTTVLTSVYADPFNAVTAEDYGIEDTLPEDGAEEVTALEENAEAADLAEEDEAAEENEDKLSQIADSAENNADGKTDPNLNEITATGSTVNYEYSYSNDEATITKYIGTDTNVVIPDTLGGYKVTAIGIGAFYNCTELETVELSKNITTISGGHNYGRFGAFEGCTSLKTVKFNDALTTIDTYAFYGCEKLEEAKFGANLAYIGDNAFNGCKELAVLQFTDTTDLENTALQIGLYAFEGCERLTKIVFPNSLSKIDIAAFYNCTRLETVELNGNITTISGGHNYGRFGAFEGCTSLKTVKFNDALTTIDSYAFYGCEKLEKANFTANLTYIGEYAFGSCKALEEAKFGAKLAYIGSNAFDGCKELAVLEFTDTTDLENTKLNICSSAFSYCERLTKIVLPNSLSAMDTGAFHDCTRLETVELNGSLTTISGGEYYGRFGAFEGCTSLKTVKFNDALTTIESYVFRGCEKLEEAKFGANLAYIGDGAFGGCKELAVLEFTDTTDLENTKLNICSNAFSYCERLTKIVFPNSLSAMGTGAFHDCTRLETVELNGSLTTISGGEYYGRFGAFEGCTSLKTVKFNDALTTIESYVFRGCENLEEAKFGANLAYIGDGAFVGCKELAVLEFTDTTDLENTKLNICSNAFSYCERLTKIVFPNSLSEIGIGAFHDCTRLETVELNGSITTISGGEYYGRFGAFEGCKNLKTVKFNDALTTIDGYVFRSCEMLEEAKFGANLAYIGDCAFEGCKAMNTITIPASVEISGSAFKDSGLKVVCCPNNCDSALWAIDSNYTVVLSDNDRTPPKHSKLDYSNSTFVINSSGSYSTTLSYKFTELMPGEIKVKIPAYTTLKNIAINGKDSEDYTLKDEHIYIPVNNTEGKITITFQMENGIYMPTYATVTYDQGDVTDIIGIINEKSVCNSENGIVVANPNVDGLTLDVTKTSADDNAVTYNISLKDKNGKTVALKGEALVRIPLPKGWSETDTKVFRKEADGTYTNMNAKYIDGFMIFTTDHFSEYAVSTKNLASKGLLGDINNDKKVTIADARMLLQAASGSRVLTEEQKAVADVNGDGKITIADARWLLQVASGSRVLDN